MKITNKFFKWMTVIFVLAIHGLFLITFGLFKN